MSYCSLVPILVKTLITVVLWSWRVSEEEKPSPTGEASILEEQANKRDQDESQNHQKAT